MAQLLAGMRPSLAIGGVVFTDLANLITLVAGISSNTKCTFRKPGTSAGYQVTSGKTLTIKVWSSRASGATSYSSILFYADNDLGFDSSSSPTNPVYWVGSSTQILNIPVTTSTDPGIFPVNFPVASQKYPGVVISSAATLMVMCYGYET